MAPVSRVHEDDADLTAAREHLDAVLTAEVSGVQHFAAGGSLHLSIACARLTRRSATACGANLVRRLSGARSAAREPVCADTAKLASRISPASARFDVRTLMVPIIADANVDPQRRRRPRWTHC